MAEAVSPGAGPRLPTRLVLFDGVCNFCDVAVRWLLARDPGLSFATLQGDTAALLRERHPEIPEELETMVFVDVRDGRERIYLRSDAAFRILAEVTGPWRVLAWLRWLPRGLTDFGYRFFVRHRYRIFGRSSECRIPTPEERSRFLD